MLVLETGTGPREIIAGSALIDALKTIGDALDGDEKLDPQKAWDYLKQLLLVLKGKSGIADPALFELINSLTGDPKAVVVSALKEELLIKAANRLAKLQGDQQWLVTAGGGEVDFLHLDDVDQNDPARLDWKADKKADVPAGAVVFAVSGEAKTALEFEVMDKARAEEAFGLNISNIANSRLAVFSLSGGLGVNLESSGSGAAKLNISGGLSASGSMRYVYQEPANVLTIWMLVQAMRTVTDPFDLNAVAKSLSAPGVAGLRQIRFDSASTGWLDLDLNLARAISVPTLVKTPTDDAILPLNQSLDLTVKVGYRASGARTLVIERLAGNTLVLTSTHNTKSTRTAGLDLSAGIELSGLGEVAKKWAEHLLPDLGAELTPVLEKYSTPGDLLKSKITTRLTRQDDWAQRLGELLLGETTTAVIAEEIKKHIKDELDTHVDIFDFLPHRADELGSRAEQLANRLTSRLTTEHEMFGVFAQDLSAWIEKAVRKPLGDFANDFRKDLDGATTKLANRSEATVEKALQPLTHFGLSVNDAIADLNNLGERITGPAIKFLKRYGEQRDKLIAAVAQSAKAKIALSIQLQNQREDALERNWITRLRIPAAAFPKDARTDYRRWLAGRLPLDADFGRTRIGEAEGSITTSITSTQTANVSMDLGPLMFNYDSVIKADAEFRVGLDGTILVGSAGFSVDETAGKRGKRSVDAYFSGQIPVVTAAGVAAEPCSLGYIYTNERAKAQQKAEDVGQLLESITRYEPDGVFGVLRGRSRQHLSDEVEHLGDRPPIRVKLSGVIPGVEFDRLIRNGLNENRFGDFLWTAYVTRDDDINKLAVLASGSDRAGAVVVAVANFKPNRKGLSWRRELAMAVGFPSDAGRKSLFSQARKMHDAFNGLRNFFHECKVILDWRDTLKPPANATAKELEAWAKQTTEDAYRAAKKAANGLRKVVDPSATARVNDEVPPDYLALMAYLDDSLSDDQVVAALNLESGQGDDKWELVRA